MTQAEREFHLSIKREESDGLWYLKGRESGATRAFLTVEEAWEFARKLLKGEISNGQSAAVAEGQSGPHENGKQTPSGISVHDAIEAAEAEGIAKAIAGQSGGQQSRIAEHQSARSDSVGISEREEGIIEIRPTGKMGDLAPYTIVTDIELHYSNRLCPCPNPSYPHSYSVHAR